MSAADTFMAMLGIGVDSSQVKTATADLEKLTTTAEKTEKSVEKVGKSAKSSQDGVSGMSGAMKLLSDEIAGAGSGLGEMYGLLGKLGSAAGIAAGGVVALAAGIAALTLRTAELYDSIGDMAEEIGVSVTEMDRLRKVARESGASMEDVVSIHIKLQRAMSEATDKTSKQSTALRVLGLDAKASEQDVIQALASMESGANKNVVMMTLLGKSGVQYNELVKDLATNTSHIGKVSQEAAADADRLTRSWNNFKGNISDLFTSTFAPFMEYLDNLLEKTKLLSNWWANFDWKNSDTWDPVNSVNADLEIGKAAKQNEAAAADLKPKVTGNFADEEAKVETAKKLAAEAKKAADELAKLEEKWNDVFDGDAAGLDAKTIKGISELDTLLAKGKISLDQYGKGLDHLLAQDSKLAAEQKQLNEQTAAYNKLIKESEDADIKKADALRNTVEEMVDQNAQLEKEVALIGKTIPEQIAYVAQLEREKIAKMDISDVARQRLIELSKENEALQQAKAAAQEYTDAQKKMAEESKRTWEDIANKTGDFFSDLVANGTSAFKSLGQSLKKWFISALYEMTMKKWIVGIGTSMSGGMANAAGNVAGSAFGGGDLISGATGMWNAFSGTASGMASSFAYSGVGSSLGLSTASTVGAELAGSSLAGGLGAGAAGEAVGSLAGGASLTGAGSALVAAAPYLAVAAIAYMAISSFLKSKRGGPKTGGFGSSGDISGITGTDAGRYFTPNQGDSAMNSLTAGLGSSYDSTLASLGGTGVGGFAVGFDTDPQGKANNRAHIGSFVNGRQVYDYRSGDESLGRDEETLNKTIELESKRALLAAIQASDLPANIAKIINSVDAGSATSDTIDNVLALGQAVAFLGETLSANPMEDALEAIANASDGAFNALQRQGESLVTLANNYDGTAAAAINLSNATAQYYANLVTFIAQVQQMKTSISEGIEGTKRSMTLQTLTDQEKGAFYNTEIDKLRGQMATSTDPTQINNLTNRIIEDMTASFNLLSPEEQKANLDTYLKDLDTLNTEASTRLTTLQETAQNTMTAHITTIKTVMENAADKIATAAGSIQSAADKGVKLDVNVNVDVDGPGTAEVQTSQPGGG